MNGQRCPHGSAARLNGDGLPVAFDAVNGRIHLEREPEHEPEKPADDAANESFPEDDENFFHNARELDGYFVSVNKNFRFREYTWFARNVRFPPGKS
jgi:hypothetical protein